MARVSTPAADHPQGRLRSAAYRIYQLWRSLAVRRLDQAERAAVAAALPERALPIFYAMSRNDQRHSLTVYRALLASGCDDTDLLAAALLPSSRVVAAFHHVSAALLLDPAVESLDTDVLVLGDDREATEAVQRLAADIPGVRGLYAGRLRNARQVEALTANLISINRRYKAHSSIRITDVTAEST